MQLEDLSGPPERLCKARCRERPAPALTTHPANWMYGPCGRIDIIARRVERNRLTSGQSRVHQ